MFDVEYGVFLQTPIFEILLGTIAQNKGLECTIAYNNIESGFPNHVFYINFS